MGREDAADLPRVETHGVVPATAIRVAICRDVRKHLVDHRQEDVGVIERVDVTQGMKVKPRERRVVCDDVVEFTILPVVSIRNPTPVAVKCPQRPDPNERVPGVEIVGQLNPLGSRIAR